jgi:gliding motility-associated-like protein
MRQLYKLVCLFIIFPTVLLAHTGNNAIEFVENRGQWDGPFRFSATAGNNRIFLQDQGFYYVLGAADNFEKLHAAKEGRLKDVSPLRYHAYKVVFEGSNPGCEIMGLKPQQHYYNYFLGKDPQKWKSNIHPNLAVDYKSIYDHIDLHISSEAGTLKYEFIINPGGDVGKIIQKYEGVDGLTLKNGKLVVSTSVGVVEEYKPYVFQYINGERVEVPCRYKLSGDKVSYHFPEGYDKTKPLVIDPTVVFATFTGSGWDNWGFTATYDASGNFYAGSAVSQTAVQGTNGFPLVGAYQSIWGGGGLGGGNNGGVPPAPLFPCDIGITKFNAAGNGIIYSTFIGGSDNDQPHSLWVSSAGELVLAGRTYSSDYPVQNGYDQSYNGNADIVVTRLNVAGNALVGSTFVGGSGDDCVNVSSLYGTMTSLKQSYADDARSEVIMDNQGNVYVAACTKSTNFPLANATLSTLSGTQDGVAIKLNNNLSTLLWSTYLGGSGDDAAYVLTLNQAQSHVYVAGGTASSNFPMVPGGLWNTYNGGIADGFIVKFQNSGVYPFQRGTFIGRASYDQVFGIQVDQSNNVYATGNTLGGTFPVTPSGVYSNAASSQFIIKLDSNLGSIVFSTVFGSGNSAAINVTPVAFLVDTCENVYVSGWGGTLTGGGGSTAGMPVNLGTPSPAPVSGNTDGNDFYFFVLSKNAIALLFAGYYGGGSTAEHVDGGTSRFDRNGVVYQAICGGCGGTSNVPTTAGSYSTTNGSGNCNLLALKIAFNLGAVKAQASASPSAVICIGESVNFTNGSTNAASYEWDFGDGTPGSTSMTPTHQYNLAGLFTVRMIAINPNACKVRDTVFLTITVDTNNIHADFTTKLTDSCNPYIVAVTNISKYGKTPAATSFLWKWGDGGTSTGTSPAPHSYSAGGSYTITLVMTDTTSCNSPDSISKTIVFNSSNVKAAFNVEDICIGRSIDVSNNSANAVSYAWHVNGKEVSTASTLGKKFDTAGSYKIKLLAYNPTSCNKVDSTEKTIIVHPAPTADFAISTAQLNEPFIFTNKSVGADLYNWNFGDGEGSQESDPIHMYRKTGSYTTCLIASNKFGCSDTICRTSDAKVQPAADIPNAFSPNGDGNNDILFVKGAAVESMNVKVFNRWGEKVFESNDMKIGWDGTYKGKEQEMEAYAYVLNVTFIDGTTFYKKGNVTLLR